MRAPWQQRRWVLPADEQLVARRGQASVEALDPQRLRVLVWNVYKGRRRSFGQRFRTLARDRDLILAQELYFAPTMHTLLGELALEWTTATSFHYARRDNVGTGLGTAARAPSRRARALVTRGREALTRTPKLALLTEHALGEDTLLVANVHAINFAGYADFDAQLARIEAALGEHQGPLLLAGDFNTWSRRRQRRLELLGAAVEAAPVRFRNDRRAAPLDHVLVRGLQVEDASLEPSRASDHAALCLELAKR